MKVYKDDAEIHITREEQKSDTAECGEVVLAGNPNVGKSTVLKQLIADHEELKFSVSATTRQPRPGEENGVHYYFLTKEEFLKKVEEGNMLEYAQYNSNYYGNRRCYV